MEPKILATGYNKKGWSLEGMEKKRREHDWVVADCRINPHGGRGEWRQSELQALMGDGYVWIQDLGNINYRGGAVRLKNPEAGLEKIKQILDSGKSVLLLCACAMVKYCHLAHVVVYVQDYMKIEFEEIEPSYGEKIVKIEQLGLFGE